MSLSPKKLAALRVLLEEEDDSSDILAALFESLKLKAPAVPPVPGAGESSDIEKKETASVKDETQSVKIPDGSETSKNPFRKSGAQETAKPTVPSIPDHPATTHIEIPSYLSTHYNRLIPPPHDKFVKFSDNLSMDGKNFAAWSRFCYSILKNRHLDSLVDGYADDYDPLFGKADTRAYLQISGNIEMNLLNEFQTTNAFDLWQALQQRFIQSSTNARSSANSLLRSKLIGSGESMEDHIKQLRVYRTQLINAGGTIEDDDWKGVICSSLMNTKWDAYTLYSESCKGAKDFISHLLLVQSRKAAAPNNCNQDSALLASNNRRSTGNTKKPKQAACTNCGGLRHTIEQCWSPGGGAEGKSTIPGREIPAHMRNKGPRSGSHESANESAKVTQESASIAEIDPQFALIAGVPERNSDWLLDTGATSHMAYNRLCFREYEPIEPISVNQAGVGHSITAIGKGSMIVTFIYAGKTTQVLLTEVLHIPDLVSNLLSGTKLTKAGTSVVLLAQKAIFY